MRKFSVCIFLKFKVLKYHYLTSGLMDTFQAGLVINFNKYETMEDSKILDKNFVFTATGQARKEWKGK